MALSINDLHSNSTKNRNSRLVQGGSTDIYNNRLGWWAKRKFEKHDDDYIVMVLEHEQGRPDLISYRMYNKAIYAWVVLQYNSIVDPEVELTTGVEIILPTHARLLLDIISKPVGGNKTI